MADDSGNKNVFIAVESEEQIMLGIGIDLGDTMRQIETNLIRMALGQKNGNIAQAARLLRMTRTALHYKINKRKI
jgi:DNA-binding NtrC family response regulator